MLRTGDSDDLRLILSAEIRFGATTKMGRSTWNSSIAVPVPLRIAEQAAPVRRVVRKIRKHATWLDQPHFATLLYTYGLLFVRFIDLHAVQAEPTDELGRPNAIADQLQRIAGRLSQLATQLGLSPAAE